MFNEITLVEYNEMRKGFEYNWVSNAFANNPAMTLEKLFASKKWELEKNKYDVYIVVYPNNLKQTVILKKDNMSTVFTECLRA